MATGTVVLVEPAPIDLLLMVLLVFGLLLGKLAFVPAHEAPLVLLAIFLAANIISMVNAGDMETAIRYFGITAYLAASWVFFTGVLTRHGYRAVRILMNGYTIGGLVSVIPGTLSYFRIIGHQDFFLRFGRPQGFFKDPNVFGPYMVPIVIWAIVRLQAPTRLLVKAWWLAVALLAASAIFFSYSRGCWINCMVSVAVYFGLRLVAGGWDARKVFHVAGVFAGLLIVGGTLALVIVKTDPRLEHMLRLRLGYEGLQAYDINHRFYAQHLAMEAVHEKPLGLGPGQTEVTFTIATHNMFLRALVENGVLGALALFAIVALTVIRMLRLALKTTEPRWRSLFIMAAACTAGLLVNALAIDTNHWRHMWLLLALVWVSPPAQRSAPAPSAAFAQARLVPERGPA